MELAGLIVGIRKGRRSYHVHGIRSLIAGDETFTEAGVHGAVGRAGLVRKAGKVILDETFLEVLARVFGHDFLPQLRRKLIEASSKHIETDSRIKQSYFGAHVLSDAGSGVQSNGLPCNL